MHYRQIEFPAFHVTTSEPCPYLEGRRERKIFTIASEGDAKSLYNALSKHGFRRSQFALYKTSCGTCNACLPVRIRVKDFQLSSSQKRIVKQNRFIKRRLMAPIADLMQYEIFKKYVVGRHGDGYMASMQISDFQKMVEETAVNTTLVTYFDRRPSNDGRISYPRLVAACITDSMDDGLSMVYSYFDPDFSCQSLGIYMILDHIELAEMLSSDNEYVYLGYWVPTCRKMDYKKRFKPIEVFLDGEWIEVRRADEYTPDDFPEESKSRLLS